MKTLLHRALVALLLTLSATAQAQYKNFAPQQALYDSIYTRLVHQVPPAYNLLYDKSIILSGLGYCDGDWFTDTLNLTDVLQQYTEVINMNTKGVAGYEQFDLAADVFTKLYAQNGDTRKNSILLLNYNYSVVRNADAFTRHILDSSYGYVRIDTGYHGIDSTVYLPSRVVAGSASYNEYDPTTGTGQTLWLNPNTYYGNDVYSMYKPIIMLDDKGFVQKTWNDSLVLNFTDTLVHTITVGLVKGGGDNADTLFTKFTMGRKNESQIKAGYNGITQNAFNPPVNIENYSTPNGICGIPHEQPVWIQGDINQRNYMGVGTKRATKGMLTISYGFQNGVRRTTITNPAILVDGVDFGTKNQSRGYNRNLSQCGGTGYVSFKTGADFDTDKFGQIDVLVPAGEDRYSDTLASAKFKYHYAYRNLPSFIDSVNQQGYDFIFVDFPEGADDMRNNAMVVTKLLGLLRDGMCNSKPLSCTAPIKEMSKPILCGASMGGQVVRYALTYMEFYKQPHNVKQYVAFDSPHNGANVPIGLQVMANSLAGANVLGMVKFNDMVIRKLNQPAPQQLLLMYYECGSPYAPGVACPLAVAGTAHPMRTVFYNDLAAMGNWPTQCEKVAIANGSGLGTQQNNMHYGDSIVDMHLDYNDWLSEAQINAQKKCGAVKGRKGAKWVGQVCKCGAAKVKIGLTRATMVGVAALDGCIAGGALGTLFTLNPATGGVVGCAVGAVTAGTAVILLNNFKAMAYCPNGQAGCKVFMVKQLGTFNKTYFDLTPALTVLDNAPGGGNDALAASAVGVWQSSTANNVDNYHLDIVQVPNAFFSFIPTTSALALNTQGVAGYSTHNYNGNEQDRVANHIPFDYEEFNLPHPTKTVFDRVFYGGNDNEQHVEVTYNGDANKKELSKITQFLHVARTAQEYWPNGNTPPAPERRVLENLSTTNTYVQHYNFDTLVTETNARNSTIKVGARYVTFAVPIGNHIINKNGYLGINEYAPPSLFDTKANNSYVFANLPNTPNNATNTSAGQSRLKARNWQNQTYELYGCTNITVNNLGKFTIGDKDSTTRYIANTAVKQYATVTLNLGGTLTINDNSTLTFEKGSNFNYNGGNIILNGDNARLVINAGANVTLGQGTTFTVAAGSKGLGKLVFNGDNTNQNVYVQQGGQNKLVLTGKTQGQTLVEINNCNVNFEVDNANLKSMQVVYTGDNAQLTLNRANTDVRLTRFKATTISLATALYLPEPKSVNIITSRYENFGTAVNININGKSGGITTLFNQNIFTNNVLGVSQFEGGITFNNNTITVNNGIINSGVVVQAARFNNTFINNTITCKNNGIAVSGAQNPNTYLSNNVIDANNNALFVDGCNVLALSCNTFKNAIYGVNTNHTQSVVAQANLSNYTTYTGYNKFVNNLYHMYFGLTYNLYIDDGYNTFNKPRTGGKVLAGDLFLNGSTLAANNNNWSIKQSNSAFQTQFGLTDIILRTPIVVTDNSNLTIVTACSSMNGTGCPGPACRLACTNCTPITTASFANVASNVATDSVITAITDTTRTNTNYVSVASQGSQVVNYNYPSTSSIREKQLVRQAHKYQQLAHAMAISTGQLTTSSNYATPTTSVTIADIETILATAQTQGDSQTVASEQLSKVQALYVAQQYTQALSYVTTVKPSIHAGWLQHLNYWECVVQNAYALSTGAIDFETYSLQTNNCNGGATIRKRGASSTSATDAMSVTEPAEVSTTLSDLTTEDVLLIHPNPVSAGTTLTVTGEGINKLTLYSSQSVNVMEYTTNISDTEASRTSASDRKSVLEFTAPNTAGVYWLQVDYNNSVPKRYKVVVQ